MTEPKPPKVATKRPRPRARQGIAQLHQRIKEIDQEIMYLRHEQKGLEKALNIMLGEGP